MDCDTREDLKNLARKGEDWKRRREVFRRLAFRRPRVDRVRQKPFLVFGRHAPHPPRPFFPFTGMASLFHYSLLFLSFFLVSASHFPNDTIPYNPLEPHPYSLPRKISRRSCRPSPQPLPNNCFPAVGFNTPSDVPASTDGWWCDLDDEFGFLGFSYEVTTCEFPDVSFSSIRSMNTPLFSSGPTLTQLQADFSNMRTTFNSRYVRLYGACDQDGF